MIDQLNDEILDHSPSFFLTNYNGALEVIKKQGKPLIGYFTNRIPVEILYALNTYPIRMLSLGSSIQGASERYIQVFACSWLRQIIDVALSKGFEHLDGIIFSTGTCDSLQNVSDIWRKIFPSQWAYNLTFPVLTTTKAAAEYLQNEFERLIHTISKQFPENPDGLTLSNSIKLYNKKRVFLQKLAMLVSERKLEYQKFAKLLVLGDIIPIEVINTYLELRIPYFESNSTSENLPDNPRLLLIGGMFDNYRLFEVIPEFNYLVADDLSFGTRNFNFTIPQSSFLEGYAKAYLERIPDPTAFDMEKRLNGIKNQVKHHRIDGVVLLGLKWCDPDTFEFVPIQNALKDLDIPYLNIETTPDLSNQQQIQIRLTAFIEMIS